MTTTLTGLFTDIADAIRAKTKQSATISAQDFPNEILGINHSNSEIKNYDSLVDLLQDMANAIRQNPGTDQNMMKPSEFSSQINNILIKTVSKPTNLTPSATYSGGSISNGYITPSNIIMTGNNSGTNAGTYVATYTPSSGYCWDDGTTESVSITLSINKKSISGATVNLGDGLTYNGSSQTQTVNSVVIGGLNATYSVSGNTGTNATSYTLTVTGTGNFTGTATKGWSIARASVGSKPSTSVSKTYNGSSQNNGYSTPSGVSMTGNNSGTNVGTYTAAYTPDSNHKWSDGTTNGVSVVLTINKLKLTIPTLTNDSFAYTGAKTYAPTVNNFNSTYETQSGTASTTTIDGTINQNYYSITWKLKDTTNTVWSDNTTTDKSGLWYIYLTWTNTTFQYSTDSTEENYKFSPYLSWKERLGDSKYQFWDDIFTTYLFRDLWCGTSADGSNNGYLLATVDKGGYGSQITTHRIKDSSGHVVVNTDKPPASGMVYTLI